MESYMDICNRRLLELINTLPPVGATTIAKSGSSISWSTVCDPKVGRDDGGVGIDWSRDALATAREGGAQAERSRILAALEKIAPMEQPYTRRDWALEQRGATEHHAKVLKAIGGTVKEGE